MSKLDNGILTLWGSLVERMCLVVASSLRFLLCVEYDEWYNGSLSLFSKSNVDSNFKINWWIVECISILVCMNTMVYLCILNRIFQFFYFYLFRSLEFSVSHVLDVLKGGVLFGWKFKIYYFKRVLPVFVGLSKSSNYLFYVSLYAMFV